MSKKPTPQLYIQCQGISKMKDPIGAEHEIRCTKLAKNHWCSSDKVKAIEWYCVPHWDERFEAEVALEHAKWTQKRLDDLKKERLEKLEKT